MVIIFLKEIRQEFIAPPKLKVRKILDLVHEDHDGASLVPAVEKYN